MPTGSFERRLVAILSADVQGYSRLMAEDEAATVRTLVAYRAVITELVEDHRGRVVDSPGDNLLTEFVSAVDAVEAAVAIQEALRARNAELPGVRKMEFRIGINVGDILLDRERIYGDGVNIAARLEGLAEAGGVCVSGSAYDQVKTKLPLEWEALGERVFKNITEPVRVYRLRTALKGDAQARTLRGPAAITPQLGLPDRPSVVVLPFINLSPDPDQEYFADGITEDLITDLSKISGLFVIARHSAFAYKGKVLRAQDVGRELGVRYLLEGSVRRAGTRVRITTELSEAGTSGSVWAERYDRELRDLFDLQDEITRRIVEELEVTLTRGEQVRVWRRATRNPRAYDLFLRARERWFRFKKEHNLEARELAQRAVEEDPAAVGALVIVGLTYMQEVMMGWTADRAGALQSAVEFARRAIALDDKFPEGHLVLAYVHCLLGQHDEGIKLAETAVRLGPNSADIAAGLADLYNLAGRSEEALTTIRRAMRLSPLYPPYYLSVLGHACRLTLRFEEAVAVYQSYLEKEPDNRRARPNLAIVYVQLGREADARALAVEVLRRNARFSLQRWAQATPYKNAEDLERDLDALGRAGFS